MSKTPLITVLSIALILLSLVSSFFFPEDVGARILNVVTVVTAIIGAIALFLQFRKDKLTNSANFFVTFSESFYNNDTYGLSELYEELDKHYVDPNYKFDYEKYRHKVIKYLEWTESLASLIERDIIDFYIIDNILSYRFFIMVNNPQIQEEELLPYYKNYRGTFYLYNRWYKYEQKRGLDIPLEQTALHLAPGYDQKLADINSIIKRK